MIQKQGLNIGIFLLTAILFSCNSIQNIQEVSLETKKDSISYSIGKNIGTSFKTQEVDVNIDILAAAINHVINDEEALLSDEDAQKIMMAWQKEKQAEQIEKMAKKGEVNKTAGEEFLSKNKEEEGVITTESGLQYKVLKEGDGVSPGPTDKVTVQYHGMLLDGTVFDSSIERNQPATFPVNGVIPGWSEALQLMKVGSKWKIFIPSELAYGQRGAGENIGPNATLVFDVELISINQAN